MVRCETPKAMATAGVEISALLQDLAGSPHFGLTWMMPHALIFHGKSLLSGRVYSQINVSTLRIWLIGIIMAVDDAVEIARVRQEVVLPYICVT